MGIAAAPFHRRRFPLTRLDRAFGYARQIAAGDGYREALDATSDAIVVTGPELEAPGPLITWANTSFERMTGYAREELIGHSPRLLQGLYTDPAELQRLRAQLTTDGCFEGEIVNYRRGSGEYVIGWAVTAVRGQDDALVGWVSVQNDLLTDLTQARRRAMAHASGDATS